MIKALHCDTLPKPRFRYSPVVQSGPFITFSGMIALDADSGQLVGGDVGQETAKILDNLCRALPDLSLSLSDLVHVFIFTAKFDEFPAINMAWEQVFTDDVPAPARTSAGVTGLPLGALVEMSFQFYRAE